MKGKLPLLSLLLCSTMTLAKPIIADHQEPRIRKTPPFIVTKVDDGIASWGTSGSSSSRHVHRLGSTNASFTRDSVFRLCGLADEGRLVGPAAT